MTEELGGPWVVCHSCYPTTDFSDEIQSMLSPHFGGLDGELGEVDARNNVGIFASLPLISCHHTAADLLISPEYILLA